MSNSKPQKKREPITQSMRTFYVIWFGQLISTLGSGLTGFALNVYIYETTRSMTLFSIGILMFTLPGVFFSPIAGALVDRYPRRWMMILSDTGASLSTLAIFILLLGGDLEIWHIYVATFISSIFNTFQWPAQSAAVTMLVPQDQLGRAGGMVQIGEAISQLISPVLAGAIFVTWGMDAIMGIDFVTFLVAITTLLLIRIPEPVRNAEEKGKKKSIWEDIRFGLNYIGQRKGLFYLLMYFASINFFFSMTEPLLMPLLLEMGTAAQAGMVASAVGLGMLIGTLVMSAWGGPKRRVFGVVFSGMWIALMMIAMGAQPSLIFIAGVGFLLFLVFPIMNASSQALWQSKTAPDVQGRVFSVRRMLAQFTVPIAILLSGPLADKVFNPLMATDGPMSTTALGRLMGTGPGRGMGLMFVLVGVIQLLFSILALTNPRLRNVDTEVPNVEVKARSEKEVLKELTEKPAES
jgi:DHA3 family macrolide efflux protein-like MFS transporter